MTVLAAGQRAINYIADIIQLQMFRQQAQINCNCSLFPRPPTAAPPFRSPQRFHPHKENRSKKSLKCHSSSRTKHLQRPALTFNPSKIATFDKEPQAANTPNLSTIASTRIEAGRGDQFPRNNAQNLFSAHGLGSHESEKHNSIFFPMKQSNQSIGQNYMSTRAASPLGPYDGNAPAQKRVTFNYQNQYDFRPTSTKILACSPPPPQKSEVRSGAAVVGSCVPNNSELRKKYLQQKSQWSKQSIAPAPTPEIHKASIQSYLSLHSPEDEKHGHFSRPRTSTNAFGLSRLTEMLNEKEETESIYEGEKGHEEGGIEYSRVLISCRKLMEDKNGVLEESAQTKLFGFEEAVRGGGFRRSGLFDQITIVRQ